MAFALLLMSRGGRKEGFEVFHPHPLPESQTLEHHSNSGPASGLILFLALLLPKAFLGGSFLSLKYQHHLTEEVTLTCFILTHPVASLQSTSPNHGLISPSPDPAAHVPLSPPFPGLPYGTFCISAAKAGAVERGTPTPSLGCQDSAGRLRLPKTWWKQL